MNPTLILEIVKIIGTIVVSGIAGYEATDSWQGALAASSAGLGGLFLPAPKKVQ